MAYYKLSPKAEDDLYQIWLFGLTQFGEAQADRYYNDLLKQFTHIARSPLQYPSADTVRQGYRRSVQGSHAIYYRIQTDAIEIMRIIGHQDF